MFISCAALQSTGCLIKVCIWGLLTLTVDLIFGIFTFYQITLPLNWLHWFFQFSKVTALNPHTQGMKQLLPCRIVKTLLLLCFEFCLWPYKASDLRNVHVNHALSN